MVGMVPMVMDALHFGQSMHHYFRALGGWPFAFQPYFDLGLTTEMDSEGMRRMMVGGGVGGVGAGGWGWWGIGEDGRMVTGVGVGVGCQDIIDPYSYLERLTMPKLIIVASNDEFFMMDDRWGGGGGR